MSSLLDQTEILNNLAQIIYDSAPESYSEIGCDFDYDYRYDDGSCSVGGNFWFVKDGKKVSDFLNDPTMSMLELIPKLHSMMKSHTGAEWTSFTLTLNKDGKAHTKFHYPEAKPE